MQISDAGLALIKVFEGFRPSVYKDTAGFATIAYGHKLRPGESFPRGVTEEQGTGLLRGDVATAEHAVNTFVKVELKQCQFDALCSFTYNLGGGTLEHSTLLKLVNEGKYAEAAEQFPLWDHAGGVVSAGVLRRREAERAMFMS
jgi:lysozyme